MCIAYCNIDAILYLLFEIYTIYALKVNYFPIEEAKIEYVNSIINIFSYSIQQRHWILG